nr:unnamed protein product [Spirometra erinaceieuropaei]
MPEVQQASELADGSAKEKPPDHNEPSSGVLVDSEAYHQDSGENKPRKHQKGKKEHGLGITPPSEGGAHATFVLGERPVAEATAAEEENRLIPAFVQLSVLCSDPTLQNPPEWREVARWIKFEEEVEEYADRWSKPHVAVQSLMSVFEVRSCLAKAVMLLDLEATTLESICETVCERLVRKKQLASDLMEQTKNLLHLHHSTIYSRQKRQKGAQQLHLIRSLAEIGKRQSAKEVTKMSHVPSRTLIKSATNLGVNRLDAAAATTADASTAGAASSGGNGRWGDQGMYSPEPILSSLPPHMYTSLIGYWRIHRTETDEPVSAAPAYTSTTSVRLIGFAAAFDSVHHGPLWRIMALVGVSAKIVAMIKAYYRSITARVLVRNNLSQPFGIRSGVRQGCILSPILFNYAIDWILARALHEGDGVEFAPGHRPTDLAYADYIALLASSSGDLQSMVSRVNEVAKSVGLSINVGKTKVFSSCIPDQGKAPLGIDGCQFEAVDGFNYLGTRLLPNGQSKDGIVSRIDAARRVVGFNFYVPEAVMTFFACQGPYVAAAAATAAAIM